MAWVYDRYADKTEHAALFALQTEAKAGRVGLWRDADPVPPWNWRQAAKKPH